MKKKVFAVILAAAAICGSLSPVYAADSELVLYTWEGMFPQEVLDGFEEETGCKIVYSNFDTDETMLEKVSMAKGGDYDVVIADDYILEKIVEEGLATKLDKDKISNWGNINPLYQGQFYDAKDEYTVPYGAGIPLIVYDPEEVDIDIKGYSDLWDPSLEDSIALIGNYRVINGITLLTMGKSMNEEDVDTIAEAGEKLVELAPNVRMIQDDNTQNAIEGTVPSLTSMPKGCRFCDRCTCAMEKCRNEQPPMYQFGERSVRCFLYEDKGGVSDER